MVLFDATDVDAPYSPITFDDAPQVHPITQSHGFDREMLPALDAVWFVLHLPRRLLDTLDLPLRFLSVASRVDLAHHITLVPMALLEQAEYVRAFSNPPPVLVLAAEVRSQAAETFAAAAKVPLGVVSFDALTDSTLMKLWKAIAKRSGAPVSQQLSASIPLLPRTSEHATALAAQFLARQQREQMKIHAIRADRPQVVDRLIHIQATVNAWRHAEEGGFTAAPPEAVIREFYSQSLRTLKLPTVLVVPGAATLYRRRLAAKLGDAPASDAADERGVMAVLAAHRGAAWSASTIVTDPIPPDLWGMYVQLESHCATAHVRPHAVWRMLRTLGTRIADVLGPDVHAKIRRSSSLTAFTDFPIGLAMLPGDSSPLNMRVPLNQLALSPLTRCLQFELAPKRFYDWSSGVRVLIAECLPPSDPLWAPSNGVWRLIAEVLNATQGSRCDVVAIRDEAQLNAVLRAEPYDLLILSAHGAYDRSANMAAICIRETPSLLLEVEQVPPVVMLSACEVSPRAFGAVSAADLLFRHGASVVIGTLVPIDLRRNAYLLNRFATYISDAIEGRTQFDTLGQLWHHVLSTHAVHDIYAASRRVQRWAFSFQNGRHVDAEFKNVRSVGRLRAGTIHKDSETVLLEIARDRGFEDVLRSTLKSCGYFPESVFYTLLGRGDRIVLSRSHAELLHTGGMMPS
ncbi:MAG: hypothetical protein WC538_03770 [Thermoanaerobaculia bacterium]|jgi:hypothetical protein